FAGPLSESFALDPRAQPPHELLELWRAGRHVPPALQRARVFAGRGEHRTGAPGGALAGDRLFGARVGPRRPRDAALLSDGADRLGWEAAPTRGAAARSVRPLAEADRARARHLHGPGVPGSVGVAVRHDESRRHARVRRAERAALRGRADAHARTDRRARTG